MRKFLKPRKLLLIALVATVSAGSLFYFSIRSNHLPKENAKKMFAIGLEEEEEEGMEQAEGGSRRWQYEFKLLRDPNTGTIPEGIRKKEFQWVRNIPFRVREEGFNTPQANTYIAVGPSRNGGRSRTIAYDIRYNGTTNKVMLSGGINGGIFRSTDGGETWTFVHPVDQIRSVSCLAQDPRPGFQDTWYAGTGEPLGASAQYPNAFVFGYGIFKSTNNGLTWSKLSITIVGDQFVFDNIFDLVNRIAVNPANGDVYAAVQRTIVRSKNGGTSWEEVLAGITGGNNVSGVTDLLINKTGSRLFATITGRYPERNVVGVWTSTSGDTASWTRIAGGVNGQTDSVPGWKAYNNTISAGNFTAGWGRTVLTLSPSNQNILYALVENSNVATSDSLPEADLFKADLGTNPITWTNLSASLTAKRISGGNTTTRFFEGQGGYNMCMAVHATNPNLVMVGGVNLFRSTDGFTTPNNTTFIGGLPSDTYDDPNFYSHVDFHFLVFDPTQPNRLVTTSDGGIVFTNDATLTKPFWDNMNGQFQTLQYYHVGIDPTAGSRTYFGGSQDNSTSFRDVGGLLGSTLPDSNDHYILIGGDGGQVGMTNKNSSNNQYLFGAAQEGQFFRVKLFPPFNNTTFTAIKPSGAGLGEFVTYFHLDEDNTNNLYYVSEDTLYRTTSSTTVSPSTWTRMDGIHQTLSGSIFSMATTRGSYTPNSMLLIGTSNARIYRLKDPANTSASTVPDNITPSGISNGSIVYDIAVNPRNHDTVMAVVSNYGVPSIFWTGNATAASPTWQVIEGNLTLPSVRSCAIVAKTTGVEYYVGTSIGLFSTGSVNGNSTQWSREEGGAMTTAIVNSLAYRWKDNTLLVGTHGNGMFVAYIGNAVNLPTGVNDPIRNDKNFIREAYPTLTSEYIRYYIGNMYTIKSLRVQVTSLSGQVVYDRQTGYQDGQVDVQHLAKGAYILTVTSPDRKYQFVKKFVKS